jgi:transcription elongation factor Elf1
MSGEFDFTCPECGKLYPIVAMTAKGTCMSCGSAKKSAGARKSLFVQRSKYNKFTLSAMRLRGSLAEQTS